MTFTDESDRFCEAPFFFFDFEGRGVLGIRKRSKEIRRKEEVEEKTPEQAREWATIEKGKKKGGEKGFMKKV